MVTHVGRNDRVLSIVVGLALIASAIGHIPAVAAQIWGRIEVIPLATASSVP